MSSIGSPAEAPSARRPFSPPLRYRLTGRLNWLVWRLPLPRRVVARLSALVYRSPPMAAAEVARVMAALEDAGVRCGVSGGWGVDALAGTQTRTHRDLDLIVAEGSMAAALDALARLGYRQWYRSESEVPLFSRVVLQDHDVAGRAVDLHPADLGAPHMELASGTIGGRAVPCISASLQLKAHGSYRPRLRDRADIKLLRRLREGPASTLIVPIPAADPLLHASARDEGLPAHITLLYPFLPGRELGAPVHDELASLLAAVAPFDVELGSIGRFPGVVYLAPEPAQPLVALTEAIVERWPERQPYGGAFEEVVPHVTVAYGGYVPEGLEDRLPVTAHVSEVWLMGRSAARWVRRAAFPLGG